MWYRVSGNCLGGIVVHLSGCVVVVDAGGVCSVSGGLYRGAAELNILEDDIAEGEAEIVDACLIVVSFMLLVVGIVVAIECIGIAGSVEGGVGVVGSCRGFVIGVWE